MVQNGIISLDMLYCYSQFPKVALLKNTAAKEVISCLNWYLLTFQVWEQRIMNCNLIAVLSSVF